MNEDKSHNKKDAPKPETSKWYDADDILDSDQNDLGQTHLDDEVSRIMDEAPEDDEDPQGRPRSSIEDSQDRLEGLEHYPEEPGVKTEQQESASEVINPGEYA